MKMDLETLQNAVAGRSTAFRCVTDYQPAGGPGDKVFPPTYEGGRYATEERVNPDTGEIGQCVLLDSVQSQANRMELALLEEHYAGKVELPLLVTCFDQDELHKKFTVTSLDAPHRIADALFRDSLLGDTIFRKSDKGSILDYADIYNATGLFGLCPTALLFGVWDSTGPRGGLGVKFQRALVSEIIGYDAVPGVKTSSRIDPAAIRLVDATIYERKSVDDKSPHWTFDEKDGGKKAGSGRDAGRPSNVNHGNVTPDYAYVRNNSRQIIYDTKIDEYGNEVRVPRILGGFTISRARQTTVLSLSALRRLRFPLNGSSESDRGIDQIARTVIAALGIAAGTLAREDTDLRSRCQLFAEQEPEWELLDRPGQTPEKFAVTPDDALELLNGAIANARNAGLPWEGEINLTPSSELVELVRRSQELDLESAEGE